jgi:hypothetical protein
VEAVPPPEVPLGSAARRRKPRRGAAARPW